MQVLMLLAACVAPGGATDPVELTTDGGLYHLDLTPSSRPFVAGEQVSLEVVVTANDVPVEQAALTLEPWMPDMGHGLQDAPTVVELGGGAWEATWTFSMAGYWEIDLVVDAAAGIDRAMAAYDVQ